MCEGFARHLLSQWLEPYSAGIEKSQVDPLAVKVMAEKGIDISAHASKTVQDLRYFLIPQSKVCDFYILSQRYQLRFCNLRLFGGRCVVSGLARKSEEVEALLRRSAAFSTTVYFGRRGASTLPPSTR